MANILTKMVSIDNDAVSKYIDDKKTKAKILKEFSKVSSKHRVLVDEHFKVYSKKYLLILKYLKYDFNVKRFDGEKIDNEIDAVKTAYKEFKTRSRFNINRRANKLKIINDFLEEYPKLLGELKKKCSDKVYKEINFEDEYKYITDSKKLEFDFGSYLKNDGSK